MNVIGEVDGKDVIMIDDMIDTAGTMMKAAKALRDLGATSVMACCTHPVLSGPAYDRIDAGELDELVVANTIPLQKMSSKVKVLSTASMLGEVIRRVQNNESVNSLFPLHS
jgi:ribose-phosphate pyrophosphokinase